MLRSAYRLRASSPTSQTCGAMESPSGRYFLSEITHAITFSLTSPSLATPSIRYVLLLLSLHCSRVPACLHGSLSLSPLPPPFLSLPLYSFTNIIKPRPIVSLPNHPSQQTCTHSCKNAGLSYQQTGLRLKTLRTRYPNSPLSTSTNSSSTPLLILFLLKLLSLFPPLPLFPLSSSCSCVDWSCVQLCGVGSLPP